MPDKTDHTFTYNSVTTELTSHRSSSIHHAICAAGLSLLLAVSISPFALADAFDDLELPDGDYDWTQEVLGEETNNSNENTEDNSGDTNQPLNPEEPESQEPESQEPEYSEPEYSEPEYSEPEYSEPEYSDDGGYDDGWYEEPEVEVPDSSTIPYEDYSGYEGSYASNEDAWVDDTPVYVYYEEPVYEEYVEEAVEEAEEEAGEWIPETSIPVVIGYNEETRTVYGTATPGYTLRVVDGDGNYIMDVGIAEDGSFSFDLPEWYDLANISFFLVNEWGEQVSLDVTGQAVLEDIAAQELAEIEAEVGVTTTNIANTVRNGLSYSSLASSFEASEEESVNYTPYIIGGVAAVVVIGAVVGIVIGVTRSRRNKADRVDLDAQMGRAARMIPFYEGSFTADNDVTESYSPQALVNDAYTYAPEASVNDAYTYAPEASVNDVYTYAPQAPVNDAYTITYTNEYGNAYSEPSSPDAYANAAYSPDAAANVAYSPEAYANVSYSPDAYSNISYGAGDYGYNSYGSYDAYGSYDSYGYGYESGSLLHPVEEGIFVQSADTTGSLYPVVNFQQEDDLDDLERLALGINGAAAAQAIASERAAENDTESYFAPPASDTAQPGNGADIDSDLTSHSDDLEGSSVASDNTDAFIALVNTDTAGSSTTGQNQPRES